jgi:hypothetical protein
MRNLFRGLLGGKPPDKPVAKVPCKECGVMILPQTAQRTSGFCARCDGRLPHELAEARERKLRIASGEAFRPDADEWASAVDLDARLRVIEWQLEPDFYENSELAGPDAALIAAASSESASVYLQSKEEDQFDLTVTGIFGVITILLSGEGGGAFYAHTSRCSVTQIPPEQKAVRGCPCCGVGLYDFASRFHLPRGEALEIATRFLNKQSSPELRWLRIPDRFFDGRDSD